MKVVYSEEHRQHAPAEIVSRGVPVPHWEIPARADALLAAVTAGRHEILKPVDHGMAPVAAVHPPDYLDFLATAWEQWQALPAPPPAVQPHAYPNRLMSGRPTGILGKAGWYMATNSAPIVGGTWPAIRAAADVAVTAADLVAAGAPVAYALCRPPGHHAFADLAGGFCYFNNVAIAAERLRRHYARVAILDVDVHHGNGTQGIFYRRPDVMFISLHGDPADFFPFFAGYANEGGDDAGRGYNLNLPLAPGTADGDYSQALDSALASLRSYAPDALLVSLGFDAYESDPIGCLKVTTGGFGAIAEKVAALGLPTLLVQEGGYNVGALQANLSAFLDGFERGRAG